MISQFQLRICLNLINNDLYVFLYGKHGENTLILQENYWQRSLDERAPSCTLQFKHSSAPWDLFVNKKNKHMFK